MIVLLVNSLVAAWRKMVSGKFERMLEFRPVDESQPGCRPWGTTEFSFGPVTKQRKLLAWK
jgi:hypothetical protein